MRTATKIEALSRRALLADPAEHARRGVELDAAAADTVLTRDEAQQIVEKAIKMSKADGVEVQVSSGYTGNVRFAANQMSTSGRPATRSSPCSRRSAPSTRWSPPTT
jgi:hypothetical protein